MARHRAAGLPVEAMLESPRRALPHSIAWATYRILQEALTNAARHGDGGADLRVQFADDAVEISVTNPAATRPAARPGRTRASWGCGSAPPCWAARFMAKLELRDRVHAVILAYEADLVRAGERPSG